LRAPQGCLRVWVRRIQPTVREQVNLHRRLGSYPAYLSTPRRPSSHPRGFRLIHLSKSCVTKVLRHRPLQVRDARLISPADSPQRSLPRSGEAESYRSFRPCQSDPGKIFVQPSHGPDRPAANRVDDEGDRLAPAPHSTTRVRVRQVQTLRRHEPQVRHFARTFQKVLLEATGDSAIDKRRSSITATDPSRWQE
jgi:hypothetical protein